MTYTISQIHLSQLSKFIESQMGWHYPPERWSDLARSIASAAHEFGFEDAAACIQWLLSSPLSQAQRKILIGYLTIGETYFFREPKSLEALQRHVLPKLLEKGRRSEKRLKIWSAGCATGEEPYSIAILLDQMKPDLRDWHITILATDLNPAALQRAAEGVYREWSFRGTPQWVRQNYFKPVENGAFRLSSRIKQKVQFASLNLAQNTYPSFLNQTEAVDIIFCRNVLMYFSPIVMQEIVRRFYHCLVAGGWLIVSPSEASHLLFSDFTKISLPGTILYQKPEPTHPNQFKTAPLSLPELGLPLPSELPHVKSLPILKQQAQPEISPDQKNESSEAALALARSQANQGQLAEAQAWCYRAINTNKLDPTGHYLLATILAEQGQIAEAIKSLKRSLYLEPGFVLAHFTLGNLLQQHEDAKKAAKHFRNALSLLASLPPDALLPEADGMTAGRLMEIIQTMI